MTVITFRGVFPRTVTRTDVVYILRKMENKCGMSCEHALYYISNTLFEGV
jgi:hypothetical protein